jgi:hypothetical protein
MKFGESRNDYVFGKGGPPAWGLGVRLTTPRRKKLSCYENSQEASDMD